MGALVPVGGIWRSTGNGTWLSPVEGDAVAEHADQAARLAIQLISGAPRSIETVVQLKVALAGHRPAIWRSAQLPAVARWKAALRDPGAVRLGRRPPL